MDMRFGLFCEWIGGPVGHLEEQCEVLRGLETGDTDVQFGRVRFATRSNVLKIKLWEEISFLN